MKNSKNMAVVICAILVSLLSACGKSELKQEVEKPQATSVNTGINKANVLSKIKEANTLDKLYGSLQSGNIGFRVSMSQRISDSDGKLESSTSVLVCKDTDIHMFWDYTMGNENIIVAIGNDNQIFYESDKSTALLVGDAYKYIMKMFAFGENNDCILSETVTDLKKADDRIVVETETTDHCCLESCCELFGCTVDEIAKKTTCYEIDAKTYEFYKTTYTLHFKDGSTVEVYSCERTENYEKYIPNKDLMPDTESLEKHTVTLIQNPGTPEEIKQKYFVPVGWKWSVIYNDKDVDTIYADSKFESVLDQKELTEDVTGYIKIQN